jgi:predicted RNase H-like HicB family nuclease
MIAIARSVGADVLQCRTIPDILLIVDFFGRHPMQEYKAVIKQEGEWWYRWIEEMPGVNCQERSEEELMETLRVTLREAVEFNQEEGLYGLT